LIEELHFSDLHVFPYSSRPGTKAAGMGGQVPANVIKKRAELLRDTAAMKKKEFLTRQTGKEHQVLVQGCTTNDSICNGISRNYVTVRFSGRSDIINTEQRVMAEQINDGLVTGQLLDPLEADNT
jgi:threonylcarbamoyladenosine tRNA methylthiotransferase MtaB